MFNSSNGVSSSYQRPRAISFQRGDNTDVESGRPRESASSASHLTAGGMPGNGSPITRAGLPSSRSYASSRSLRPSIQAPLRLQIPVPHSQGDIREDTMQLSSIVLSPPTMRASPAKSVPFHTDLPRSEDNFIFPTVDKAPRADSIQEEEEQTPMPASLSASVALSSQYSGSSVDLTASRSASSFGNAHSGPATPRPSGLSLMLANRGSHEELPSSSRSTHDRPGEETPRPSSGGLNIKTEQAPHPAGDVLARDVPPLSMHEGNHSRRPSTATHAESPTGSSETAPLLADLEATLPPYTNGDADSLHKSRSTIPGAVKNAARRIRNAARPSNVGDVLATAVKSLPAVVLGTLLNILDGVSYGMIIFPAAGVFSDLGPMGVSMFFLSAIISQLVYSSGGSGFAGGNGSMMIEVVPFFHILANTIAEDIGEDHPKEIIATTMVAFAFSSVLTGLTFFLLGALRLGNLIGFFPRHILIGCIGGVGVFLIITGLTVSTSLSDDDFDFSLSTFKFLVLNAHNLALWAPAFGLAVLLRVITHKYHHQLIFPLYFIIIPVIFYIVVFAGHIDLATLRKEGWLFDITSSHEPWYKFYSVFDLRATQFKPLLATLPTQFALLFFNILHPPLNVPALAVSLNEDVDTNRELIGHGFSNVIAGLLGTVPNYLVYVNTLLFYRVGGETRTSGFMLAGATTLLLLIGTAPIAYIPVMVVGALIFVLGIDLVKEAAWDTRHRVSRTEQITIFSIMIVMTVWDFVMGVLFGLIVSCFFFVIQNSQRRSIRALHSGETVMSTVRRPSAHRAYIREVSKQTTVIKLQGFLFFGTIAHVEQSIRALVDGPAWIRTPIRFMLLDFSLVAGVDMSASEAFVRIQRLLAAKRIVLVLCGLSPDSPITRTLHNVDLFDLEHVELFSTLNDALEWTENAYLNAWLRTQKTETPSVALPGRQDLDFGFSEPITGSPRHKHLCDAGFRTIAHGNDQLADDSEDAREPYSTLVKAFSSYGSIDRENLRFLVPYLERIEVPEGTILWKQGDEPDGLYIIESGILRASYKFEDYGPLIEESMVPGTIAGELSALSGESRNATAVVERPGALWKLSAESLRRLEMDNPRLANSFTKLVLKAAKTDYDILLSSLATRQ